MADEPKLRFKRDGWRYIVFYGDERIGFVRLYPSGDYGVGSYWNAVDTFMEKSKDFKTRKLAAIWLRREHKIAVRENR